MAILVLDVSVTSLLQLIHFVFWAKSKQWAKILSEEEEFLIFHSCYVFMRHSFFTVHIRKTGQKLRETQPHHLVKINALIL